MGFENSKDMPYGVAAQIISVSILANHLPGAAATIGFGREGFFHIAFEVDDIRQRVEELRERGLQFKTDEPTSGFDWEVITFDESDTFVTMQLVED